ncbi:MAG: sodium/solute symporter [Pseudomonadota bacterium]
MHPLDLALVAGYLLLITAVGIGLSRRVDSAGDYFLAGRSLSWWVIGLSIIGTNVSAEGYLGAAGGAFNVGIAQANFEWIGAIPAMILAAFVFIPLYWRAGVYSIPEYLGRRYNQWVRLIAALIASVFSIFAIGVALWAIALTLETFIGLPKWLGISISALVIGLYSIAGGLRAVAFTDALQVCIMFCGGLVIVVIGLEQSGGLAGFAAQLTAAEPQHLDLFLTADHPNFPWPGVLLGLSIVLSPAYWCGSQVILQRTLGARTEWDASASMLLAAFGKTLVPLLIVFPGLLAVVLGAEIAYPDMALPWVIKNVLPPGLSGLMFIAIIAALQSTVDSSLNSTALMLTRDVRGVLQADYNPDNDLRFGRWLTLGMLLLGVACAPITGQLEGIYVFLQTLLSLFQGPMLALLVCGAFATWPTPRAGLITLLVDTLCAGVLLLLGTNMLWVAFLTFLGALLLLRVTSSFTRGLTAEELGPLVYGAPAIDTAVTDAGQPGATT